MSYTSSCDAKVTCMYELLALLEITKSMQKTLKKKRKRILSQIEKFQ